MPPRVLSLRTRINTHRVFSPSNVATSDLTYSITDGQAAGLLTRHGFDPSEMTPSRFYGEANFVWLTPEVALRVSTMQEYEQDARNECLYVPVAIQAGMPCPKLLVFDEDRDVVPTVATIYEKVSGVPFGAFDLGAEELEGIASQLAGLLYKLHNAEIFVDAPYSDLMPRFETVLARSAEFLSPDEHAWATLWARQLSNVEPVDERHFLHGDIHAMNILVDDGANPQAITALLDWSDCNYGDVAQEFAMLPPHLIPLFVRAYRAQMTAKDATLEGRVLGFMLESALYVLAYPEFEWPLSYRGRAAWNSMLRLFAEERDAAWTKWFP